MLAIKTDQLTKEFFGHPVVNQLSFSVQQGEIFGLVGPDGAGKTTTMRMIAGVLDPTSGSCEIFGEHTSLGYMSQRFGLYPELSVEENLEFYADIYTVPHKERIEREEQLLHFSGLMPFKKRLAAHLSGGMKQKLGLACALIHSPKILLLDEPTNGVDPLSRRDFWNILKALQSQGISILLTTSYLDEAERCDRIGVMHEGKLLLLGTLETLRRQFPWIIVEVILEQARKSIGLFSEHYQTQAFGNKIHILAKEDITSEVEQFCRSKDIAYKEIRIIPPTLEDIFIREVSS